MLSQHQSSLGIGCESRTGASRHHLLVFPPDPQQVLLTGISSRLQYHLGVLSPPPAIFLKQHDPSACEYGVSYSAQHNRPRQTKKEVGYRSMIRMSAQSTPPPSSRNRHFNIPSHDTNNAPFVFVADPQPAMKLHFPPRPSPPRPGKRCRPVTDVDGELSALHKKKRRLRLFLITSRLSPEFSSPATNIVDRGSSKIAVWAKQKALGRNLLRKAAILNRIRWRACRSKELDDGQGRVLVEQEKEQKQLELARLAFLYGSHDTHTRPLLQRGPSSLPATAARVRGHGLSSDGNSSSPSNSPDSQASIEDVEAEALSYRSPNDAYSSYPPPQAQIPRRSHIPLPPSPLGLSNYDAFDLEDEISDPYSYLDDDEDDQSPVQDDAQRDAGPRSPSAYTSASHTSTLSTAATGNSEALKTPPHTIYSDFNILDPGEPVIGDYDQVDEGADAIWPTTVMVDIPGPSFSSSSSPSGVSQQKMQPSSSSPNFTALFATSNDGEGGASSASNETSLHDYPLRPASGSGCEIAQEKERQKSFMFAQFNP